MSPKVVLASRNAHKVEEVSRILAAVGVDIELIGMDQYPDVPDVVEDGATFAQNAALKAEAAARATGLPSIADDSGLCVDALNGMPGVLSARWSGAHGQDRANLELVLSQIGDVPDERRGAQFMCAAALALPPRADGAVEVRVVEGVVDGTLLREPVGTGGFGYDPIFVPYGETRTTAEMSPEEKDALSHRGRALAALAPLLAGLGGCGCEGCACSA
jgi:XTP/dITP diphosphohydrolase